MTTFNISANISASTSVVASGPNRLRAGVVEDVTSIKPIFAIDGVQITEHNRRYSLGTAINSIINTRWNGRKGVYYRNQNTKKTFTFDWSYIPGRAENTVDLNAGRDYIFNVASNQFEHSLTIRNLDSNGLTLFTVTSYNVLVVNYTETLVRRDLNNDEYYWDCSLTLEEV